ncbi:MAG: hypothetical protein ABIH23_14540 [bacterium]
MKWRDFTTGAFLDCVNSIVRLCLLCVIAIVLTVTLIAQDQPGHNAVLDFSTGLVTAKNPLNKRFDEASIAWNVDLTRNRGELGPRLGYSERAELPLVDSILWNGIFVAQYRDGTKEFLAIGKWEDSAWAGIFVSDPNEFGFGKVDSTILRPDTAIIRDSLQSAGFDDFELWLDISVGTQQWVILVECLDSGVIPSVIVDSFVAKINTSGASSYVTAYDLGDSLSIEEDDPDYQMAITGGGMTPCWPYTFRLTGPITSLADVWVSRTINTAIDSASIISSRFPATGTPRFAQFRDKVYIVNGVGRGKVISNGGISDWPLRAAGEPSILPTTDSSAPDRTYRYTLKFAGPEYDSAADGRILNRIGTLSSAVSTNNATLLLYDWPLHNKDQWEGDTAFYIEIWRTLGDIGAISESDYVYLVDSILIDGDDSASTVEYVDTTSDATLHTRDSIALMPGWSDTSFSSGCFYAPDTLLKLDSIGDYRNTLAIAPGVPTILSGADLTSSVGIWADGTDTLTWNTVVGFAWMVVPVDTNRALIGDSSRSMWLHQRFSTVVYTNQFAVYGTDTLNVGFKRSDYESVNIVLPRDGASSGLMYDLYRAPIIPITKDSSRFLSHVNVWHYSATEVETPAFYFLGQYNPGDTVSDSLHYDSLLARDIYRRSAVPEKMFDIVAAANRLIAVDDQSVYMSEPVDSMVRFNILQQRMIQPDGGDVITGVWESGQGVVKIAKTAHLYDYYRSGGLWQLPELSKYYGMIAPLSHASAPEGDYFLSLDGVRLESEGVYKNRSFTERLISSPLANFDDMDASVMRRAIGIAYDNKYILSFPNLDTTFVLNKVVRDDGSMGFGWTQWSVCPVGATKYRVSDDNRIIPGDSLYFILSGSAKIYTFGASDHDNGADIYWQWESGPSNPVTGNLWYPDGVALYLQSTETNPNTYLLSFKDQRDSAHYLLTNRLDTANWHEFDATDSTGAQGALYWRLNISRLILFYDTGSTSIQGLWFNVNPKERYGSQ